MATNDSFENEQANNSDNPVASNKDEIEKNTSTDDVIASETFDNSAVSDLKPKSPESVVNSENTPEKPVVNDSSELQEHVIVISKEDSNKGFFLSMY